MTDEVLKQLAEAAAIVAKHATAIDAAQGSGKPSDFNVVFNVVVVVVAFVIYAAILYAVKRSDAAKRSESKFDPDILDAATRNGVSLGITVTAANEINDVRHLLIDDPTQAQFHFDQSEHQLCQVMIDEANRVAIPPREAARVTSPRPPKPLRN